MEKKHNNEYEFKSLYQTNGNKNDLKKAKI